MGFLKKSDATEDSFAFQPVPRGFDGGCLYVESDDLSGAPDFPGEEQSIVTVPGSGIDGEITLPDFATEDGMQEIGGMGREHGETLNLKL